MLNPDEIVETGFDALRNAQPRRDVAELTNAARRQASRAKIRTSVLSLAGCVVAGGLVAFFLQPTSAIAALKESERLSAAQPIIHLHSDWKEVVKNRNSAPSPSHPSLDIWKFPDHYIRNEGHSLSIAYKDGRRFDYDDRFKTGILSTYDTSKDQLWFFDGTMNSFELMSGHNGPLKVSDVDKHGERLLAFELKEANYAQKSTDRVYVDPKSKLVRFSEYDAVSESGNSSHASMTAEYPSAEAASDQAPRFPKGLKFQTKEELLKAFVSRIGQADQSVVLKGIRTTLYGVLVSANYELDGVGVEVVTQGGAGPDFGSGHPVEIVGAKLLPIKRDARFAQVVGPEDEKFGGVYRLGKRNYVINESNDLLVRGPSQITVRTPVWRPSKSTIFRDGQYVHPPEFVGYATFTTSKIFQEYLFDNPRAWAKISSKLTGTTQGDNPTNPISHTVKSGTAVRGAGPVRRLR